MRIDPSRNRRRDIPPLADSREKILYKIRESLQTTISTSKLFYLPRVKKKKRTGVDYSHSSETSLPNDKRPQFDRESLAKLSSQTDEFLSLTDPPFPPSCQEENPGSKIAETHLLVLIGGHRDEFRLLENVTPERGVGKLQDVVGPHQVKPWLILVHRVQYRLEKNHRTVHWDRLFQRRARARNSLSLSHTLSFSLEFSRVRFEESNWLQFFSCHQKRSILTS